MNHKLKVGARGEQLAKKYLENRGYIFIAKNYKTKLGEIDIIMKDADSLVCIEVKTRNGIEFGYPEESVTNKKLSRIKKAMFQYKHDNQKYNKLKYRIDVIAVLFDHSRNDELSPEITHFSHIGY